jgi:phosphopantothenoylcysteine decarboxylase/phosphopantothenate--cysteine ligase
MWDPTSPGEAHVALADNADLVAIVPATADILSRLASGRADDLVTALALCARGPVLAAPAMHPRMWEHPATQRNVSDIAAQKRVTLVGPVVGDVASGDFGPGRMADPRDIVAAIAALLSPRDLVGLRVVVTAGPTLEDIDPVRFLGNHSSGKMGFAIAERAAARGASVILVSGPVVLPTPYAVQRIDVRSATGMQGALWEALGRDLSRADALIMAAAVADYRPHEIRQDKMKKSGERVSLELVKNPDLLAEVGARRAGKRPVLVGFALETQSGQALVESARRKLEEKRVDLVVANEANGTFGANDIAATIVNAGGAEAIPRTSKLSLADRVLDRVHALLQT